MRRVVFVVLAVVLTSWVLAYGFAGTIARRVDSAFNRAPRSDALAPASTEARQLHDRLWIADLHCDAPFWSRGGLLKRSNRGHADVPRLREGGVALQVFSMPNAFPIASNYRRTPDVADVVGLAAFANDWPRFTWNSPVKRVLFQASRVHAAAIADPAGVRIVFTTRSLAGASRDSALAVVLAVEGLHLPRGDVTPIDEYFTVGVRVFGLAHMSDNTVAGSAHGWRKYGLTEFGRTVVARIDTLGGIVDLAHASDATIDDVLAMPSVPVMVSHTGVDGTCDGPRNLSDDQLRRIAQRGGIVGIGFWKGAVCGDDAHAIARAIRYAVDVAGVDAVALGSDFDGAVWTPFDATGLVHLTDALLAEGFDAQDIARIMGLNAREFFLRNLPAN